MTRAGEEYVWLKGYAYMVRTGSNQDLIAVKVPVDLVVAQPHREGIHLLRPQGPPGQRPNPLQVGLSWSSTERMSAQQADMLTTEITAIRRAVEPALCRTAELCPDHLRLINPGGLSPGGPLVVKDARLAHKQGGQLLQGLRGKPLKVPVDLVVAHCGFTGLTAGRRLSGRTSTSRTWWRRPGLNYIPACMAADHSRASSPHRS